MDFRETFREVWTGCKYMYDKLRGREPKYDRGAWRNAHYEVAFGRSRFNQPIVTTQKEKDDRSEVESRVATLPVVEVEIDREVEVDLEGHRQWLGLQKNERYGLHPQREKSDSLEIQINRELEERGYPTCKFFFALGFTRIIVLFV